MSIERKVSEDTCPHCGVTYGETGLESSEIDTSDWTSEAETCECGTCGGSWERWYRVERTFTGIYLDSDRERFLEDGKPLEGNPPTVEAFRAAKAMIDAHDPTNCTQFDHAAEVRGAAELIDEHTGLPALKAELARLRAAMGEIMKGEGAFNREPLKHAENTIDAMKEIARRSLEPST